MAKNYKASVRIDEDRKVVESNLLFKDNLGSGYIEFTIIHNTGDDLCMRDTLTIKSLLYPKGNIFSRLRDAIKIIMYGEAAISNVSLSYSEISRLKGFIDGRTAVKKANFVLEG